MELGRVGEILRVLGVRRPRRSTGGKRWRLRSRGRDLRVGVPGADGQGGGGQQQDEGGAYNTGLGRADPWGGFKSAAHGCSFRRYWFSAIAGTSIPRAFIACRHPWSAYRNTVGIVIVPACSAYQPTCLRGERRRLSSPACLAILNSPLAVLRG